MIVTVAAIPITNPDTRLANIYIKHKRFASRQIAQFYEIPESWIKVRCCSVSWWIFMNGVVERNILTYLPLKCFVLQHYFIRYLIVESYSESEIVPDIVPDVESSAAL